MDKYYKLAEKRVKKKKKFWNHFSVYAIMMAFFFAINMLTYEGVHWWLFIALSWGISVALHYVSAYRIFHSASWEQKEMQKEIKKLYKNDSSRDDYGALDLDDIPHREQYATDNFDELKKEWDSKDFV
jgi:hypothetical protein